MSKMIVFSSLVLISEKVHTSTSFTWKINYRLPKKTTDLEASFFTISHLGVDGLLSGSSMELRVCLSSMELMSGAATQCQVPTLLVHFSCISWASKTLAKILASQICSRLKISIPSIPSWTKSTVNDDAHFGVCWKHLHYWGFLHKGIPSPCKPGNKTSYHLQR
jgi:hypothetical protein